MAEAPPAAQDPYAHMRAQLTGLKQEVKRLRDATKGWSWQWRQDLRATGPRPAAISENEWASVVETVAQHVPEGPPPPDLGPIFESEDFAGLLAYPPAGERDG